MIVFFTKRRLSDWRLSTSNNQRERNKVYLDRQTLPGESNTVAFDLWLQCILARYTIIFADQHQAGDRLI